MLRRAGLDYQEWADIYRYPTFKDFNKTCNFSRLYAFSTKAERTYTAAEFQTQDALLFGPESRGLPSEILDSLDGDSKLRIPMVSDSRSLNLSNTVSIAVYEAWRQQHFSMDSGMD